ncbi:leucyl aminopeptidase [Helicobacter monodelphidis]|uniref:leucyl aminopeptidase n=1 Tax=Helicobacter sp. 15-1451 TaxID=2004995 RepID=UPI000DCF5220|nr:leucyl aminopeptidase [Helicobacter sp. 15-1451]RAX58134.1 leucyl aminopeptidase [Helicobacter sp. 15-1451]
MNIQANKLSLQEIQADATLVFILNQNLEHRWVEQSVDFTSVGFKAKEDSSFFDPTHKILYLALERYDIDLLREVAAKGIRTLKKYPFTSFKCGICDDSKNPKEALEAILSGFLLGNYENNAYKSKKEESKLKKIIFSLECYSGQQLPKNIFESCLKDALAMADGVNLARSLVNKIPEEATPEFLAQTAKNLAKEYDLKVKVRDEKYLLEHGMGAFYAVSKASVHPPRLIHLTYSPKKPLKRIALVGKGLTYDSGGLSLKPADYMVTMKADKSGGCAVLGIINAVAKMGLNLEIHGIIGATENMIGGNAFKPDDVLTAKNGKTIEVRNTDAEGRLVLCDCLCYAQEFEPDYIIDIATLTGACVVALGEYTSGVLGFNHELKEQFLKAAKHSGELAATLPFNRHLRKLIDSKVADICNISSTRYGGSITAGLFLGEFIEEKYKDKWLHLDIAGPAYVEKEWDVNPFGGSGAGVRMVLEFLKGLARH